MENWVQLAKEIQKQGLVTVFPWGNLTEKNISEKIVSALSTQNVVPNAFSIQDAFTLIAQAKATIGVDTGLTHLSAVLQRPTIEIYVDSPVWKTEGYWNTMLHNLGDMGSPPSNQLVTHHLKVIFKSY
jgi:heptosyltransferase-1